MSNTTGDPATSTAPPQAAAAERPGTAYGPRHRWVVLAIGVAAQAAFSAMFSGLPATGLMMRADYHITTGQLGFVLGCLGLGVAVSDIVWGLLADRFGDRRILLTGLTATGLLLAAMTAAAAPGADTGVTRLGALLFAAGALGGSVNGSSGRAVMTWFTDAQRGFAMSVRQTAIPAGGAIGVAVLPPVASAFGFRAVFLVLAAFCLASAAATWRWLHEPASAEHDADEPEDAPTVARPGPPRSPLRRWVVWRVALASALLTVPQIAVLSFAGIYLGDAKGTGAAAGAVAVITAQVGGGAVRIWTGRYTDRRGDRRTCLRVIAVLGGVTMAGAAALTDAPTVVAVAALALGGLLANAWHGVAYTEIAVLAGPARAGTALGLIGTTIFGAAFVVPILVPFAADAAGWRTTWLLTAVAPLLAVLMVPRQRSILP